MCNFSLVRIWVLKIFLLFQEVLPGKLLADQLYRCPDRYLFDEETRRCQREHRVTCRKFTYNRRPYYKQGRDSIQILKRTTTTEHESMFNSKTLTEIERQLQCVLHSRP